MIDPVDRCVRAIARRNSFVLVRLQFGIAHLVMLGGLGLLALYQPMSAAAFWLLVGVSQALVWIDNMIGYRLTRHLWEPVRRWERGARDPASTVAAWEAIATLPIRYIRTLRRFPVIFSYLPFLVFATWKLGLPWYSFFILSVAGSAVLAYGLIVRYFTIEVVTRPVLEQVAAMLPPDFEIDAPGLPLRWRLLAVAPMINVITGVVVAGLADRGRHATIDDLGISWLIAVVVSFTLSLELVILVSRSVARSLMELRRATERVREGDFDVRVPVVATDETGTLAQSFNTMIEGLQERERLRSAFGAYVDPGLTERVIREGEAIEAEEIVVSVLFLDVREFTVFAERSSPHEVVSLLNELWELAVPAILRHGGHANKFIGDGLLAVFGAPDPLPDHPERAVSAALELAERFERTFDGRIKIGIGVNTGPVVAGTVGGGGRVEYTVIGDTVNTAARVEAATRETGDPVLITDRTRACLPATAYEFDERHSVGLRGKQDSVRLWVPHVRAALGAPVEEAGAASGDRRGD
jgi:adenylate cyclase